MNELPARSRLQHDLLELESLGQHIVDTALETHRMIATGHPDLVPHLAAYIRALDNMRVYASDLFTTVKKSARRSFAQRVARG